jgi:hypothetical protein
MEESRQTETQKDNAKVSEAPEVRWAEPGRFVTKFDAGLCRRDFVAAPTTQVLG